MKDYFYSVGANLPRLEMIVSGDGAAVDLTDSTGCVFLYRKRYTGTASVISGSFANKGSGIVFVNLTGSAGADITDNPGPYWGRFLIYFQNGGVRPYPEGYINLEVLSGVL